METETVGVGSSAMNSPPPPRIGLLSGHYSTRLDRSEVTHIRSESQSWRVDGCAGVVRWRDRQNHAFAP